MSSPVDGACEDLLRAARQDPHAIAVLRFGSTLAGPGRDVDVTVVLRPGSRANPSEKAIEYASFSSGRRHEGLDVSVFQALPLYIRHRVLAAHEVVWCRDEAALYDVALTTIRDWEHFRPHYEAYLEAVARG